MKFEDLSENQKACFAMMAAQRAEAKVNFLIKELVKDEQTALRLKEVLDNTPIYPVFQVSDVDTNA